MTASSSPSPPRIRAAATFVALALLAVVFVVWRVTRIPPEVASTEAAITARLVVQRAAPAHDSLLVAMLGFYHRRGDRPAWSDGRHPQAAASACAHALAEAARAGLEPADYGGAVLERACERMRAARPAAAAESLAGLDIRLTRAFLRYARDASEGRVPASALDPDWARARAPRDPLATLAAALRPGRTAVVMEALGPGDPGSLALRHALGVALDAAARGGWPRLAAGGTLRRGDSGPAVARLRRRLAAETGADTGTVEAPFDAALERTVRDYQEHHALTPSGVVDAPTRAALGVPAAERARTLALNLERRRWMPLPPPEPCILVNLPDCTLEMRDSARAVLRMRVIVGEARNPTPVFSDAVTYLQFDPTWRVPRRILVEEIAPALKRDRAYLAKNHMRVFFVHAPAPVEVPPETVDWSTAETDTFPYLVVQDGGPGNPLGLIKFMCPNEYDVYLHDTSQRSHFAAAARALSHGCVRVEQPHALAERLLAPRWAEATADSVDSLEAAGIERNVGLPRPMPVHFLYWTAWADSAGAVHYRDDLYGIDRRLDEALKLRRGARFVLNPPLEWGELHRAPTPEAAAVSTRQR